MTKTASVVFLLLMTFLVRADVFSLWPSRGGSSGVNNALQSETLWTEEVKINGHSLNLEVSLVDRTLQEALHDLRGVYKNGSAAVNSNSLLFEIPLRSGAKRRYYLVELNGIVPMLQFSMVLPADFRRGVPSVWPAEFPLPPGAVPPPSGADWSPTAHRLCRTGAQSSGHRALAPRRPRPAQQPFP